MSRLQMAAVAACGFVALSSGQVAASGPNQCWQPYEIEAAKVRDLHVMLMLGALRCKGVNKEIEAKYSAFVEKKMGLLSSYNNVLKTRFMRVNGIAEGQRAYEQFNTKLGNGQSGLAQAGSYCQMTETLLTLATEAQDRDLPQLATNFSESALGIDAVCEAQPVVTAAGTAQVASASVAAPAVSAAEAGGTGGVDAPHEAITAAGVTVAKTGEPAGQSGSAAAALEAAAVALQNAAASLKAQAAAPEAAADKSVAAPEAKPAVLQPVTASATPVG